MAIVGFIGLGMMGREMAALHVAAGHRVQVFDVSVERMRELAQKGAITTSCVAEAADGVDVVVTMLPDTSQVVEVITMKGGLLSNPPAGRLLIDMSTIAPLATRQLAAKLEQAGIAMLDAPVSGGPTGAKAAKLSIMVGGTKEAFERAKPILTVMGTSVIHVGPSGAGQTVKACNQLICAMNIQAVCEGIALGRAAGLDVEMLREVLLGGAAASWMLQNLGPQIIAKDDRAGFRIDLQLKDLRLAAELAFELGVPLPGTALATSLYLEARAHGEGSNGNQALFRVYDRMTAQETEGSSNER